MVTICKIIPYFFYFSLCLPNIQFLSSDGICYLSISLQDDSHWDVKHNQSAKGFNSSPVKVNGINNNASHYQPAPPPPQQSAVTQPPFSGPQKLGPNLPTKQYNSPKNMYSDEAIQEIMAQQAEVLAGGVKG